MKFSKLFSYMFSFCSKRSLIKDGVMGASSHYKKNIYPVVYYKYYLITFHEDHQIGISKLWSNFVPTFIELFDSLNPHIKKHHLEAKSDKIKDFTNGTSIFISDSVRFSETSNFHKTEHKARVCATRRQQPLCAALRI